MNKKKLHITLPEPCHEEWSTMKETANGRFCNSCQKEVIDFTQMTDVEIIRFVKDQKYKCCGSFLPSQLNRPIVASVQSSSFSYKKIAAGVFALLSLKDAHSQSLKKSDQSVVITPSTYSDNKKVMDTNPTDYTISGSVSLEIEDKKELSNVIIKIGNNPKIYTTDAEGHFSITLNENEISTYTIITFEHPLLKREVRSIFKTGFPVQLQVRLEFARGSGRMGGVPSFW